MDDIYKKKGEFPMAMLFFLKRIKTWVGIMRRKGETNLEFQITSFNYPYSWDIMRFVEKFFSKDEYTLRMTSYKRKEFTKEYIYIFSLKKKK